MFFDGDFRLSSSSNFWKKNLFLHYFDEAINKYLIKFYQNQNNAYQKELKI